MYCAILRSNDTSIQRMTGKFLTRLVAFGACAALSIAAPAADLTVSAAASLTNAFRELGPAFEARSAGTAVVFN